MLIMMIGLPPDTLKPGIHYVRTHWIGGFIAFKSARHEQAVMLMVPVRPESNFRERAPGRRPSIERQGAVTP